MDLHHSLLYKLNRAGYFDGELTVMGEDLKYS